VSAQPGLFDQPPPAPDVVELETRIEQLESALALSRGYSSRLETALDSINDAALDLMAVFGDATDHVPTLIKMATDRLKEPTCPPASNP
jgi:hypothetical protein